MKKINNLLIISTGLFSIIYLLIMNSELTLSKCLVLLSIIPVLLIPKMIAKLFNIKIDDNFEFTYIVFVIIAQLFGSAFALMSEVKYYDKLLHIASGILTSLFAIIILDNTNLQKRSIMFDIIFIISFTLAIAACWEIFEYTSDNLLKGDTQNVLKTGVGDTMQDIICAAISSIIYSFIYKLKKSS